MEPTHRIWRNIVAAILLISVYSVAAYGANEMRILSIEMPNQQGTISLSARFDGQSVYVPLESFSREIGAEAKTVDGDGLWAVCKADICVPLDSSSDTTTYEGTLFANLDAFVEPMGYRWMVAGDILKVISASSDMPGMGVGQLPPSFVLPDLFTGQSISNREFLGKKAVFFMWASW